MTDKNLSHEEAVRRLAEKSVTVAPLEVVDVEVQLNGRSPVLLTYVRELAANIDNVVAMRGGSIEITEEDLAKYVALLVKLRVDYVNGKRVPFRPTDMICVPSFVSLVLSSIGKVHHIELGLELHPVFIGDDEYDEAFLKSMSSRIAALGSYGLEYAKGYDRSKEGSYEFMTMCVLEGVVKSHSKEKHPVFALLAAFVEVHGTESVLTPRVTYGTVRHFQSLMSILASPKV